MKRAIDLYDEIDRTYRILDAGLAECQNKTDITEWFKDGIINETTYSALIKYNKAKYYNNIK